MPSTVIRWVRYDDIARTLLIEFQSGRRYRYADVPAATASAMRTAFSKGEFFNAHIRGHFAFEEERSSTTADDQ